MIRVLSDAVDAGLKVDVYKIDHRGDFILVGSARLQDYLDEEHRLNISAPTRDGRIVVLEVGEPIIVYFSQQEAYYKFTATVLERGVRSDSGESLPSVFITEPEKIENGNRRRHYRVEPLLRNMPTVKWRQLGVTTEPWKPVRVYDISGRGIGLFFKNELGEAMQLGEVIELSIQLPGSPRAITLPAEVRNKISRARHSADTLLGFQFQLGVDDPDGCIDVVAKYVADCQREIARSRQSEHA